MVKKKGDRKKTRRGGKKLLAAVATLNGTVMGAGFLGIPFVAAQAGLVVGLAYILILGLMIMFVGLYLGEISLRTKGNHQLTGYAEMYIGKWGKSITFLAMIFGIYAALVAYLIGEGESLSMLFFGNAGHSLYFGLAFLAFVGFLCYLGLGALKKGETIALFLVIGVILAILLTFSWQIDTANLTYVNKSMWMLPFGVVLFSLLGFTVQPEMDRELEGREDLMKKAIIYGRVIPIVAYILFTIVVVGYMGMATTEIATIGLGRIFVVLGILTMFTAALALTNALRDMYRFDYKMKKWKAWLLTIAVPLALYLFVYFYEVASFTQVMNVGGTVAGAGLGIMILLMVRQAKRKGKRKPEYIMKEMPLLEILIGLIFLLGVLKLFV